MTTWQPYVRVSTDDKGQNPQRQVDALTEWARREAQALLPAIVDKGTSATFTNPFDRARFLEAITSAKAHGAAGIVAEKVDRVCGQGSDELGWVRYELKKRGLRLVFADRPLSMQDSLVGNVTNTVDAEVRRERIATDRRRIKGGIMTRAKEGKPVGGQTQQKRTEELVRDVLALKATHPEWGYRRIAHELSQQRGAFVPSLTAKDRRSRTVSYITVRRALLHGDSRYTDPNRRYETHRSPETSPRNTTSDQEDTE